MFCLNFWSEEEISKEVVFEYKNNFLEGKGVVRQGGGGDLRPCGPKSEKYLSVPLERDVILTSGSVKEIIRFDH